MPEIVSHRICAYCNNLKPISEFYKNRFGKDGFVNHCRECHKIYNRKYFATEHGRKIRRDSLTKWNHSPHGRKNKRKWEIEYRKNNKEKTITRRKTLYAIQRGILIRPEVCSQCGQSCKPEAHHYKEYKIESALDIIWLCKPCHRKAHGFEIKYN